MTGTLIFMALGVLLLGILLAIALFCEPPEVPGNEQRSGSPAIFQALELSLPSRQLADRIFDRSDLDFVLQEAPSLRHAFLQERTNVAILWLKDTRNCIRRIFRFYRTTVRDNANLEFWTELKIASDYFSFVLVLFGLRILIYLLGPFLLRGMATRTFAMADRVSAGLGRTLGAMDPSALTKIRDDWARQTTPAEWAGYD
jgi:hypothetical protein